MKRRHAGVLVLLAVVALLLSGHARPALTDAAWNDQAYARSDFGTGRWAYAEASAQLIEAEALSLDVAQAIRTQAEYPDSPGAYRADIDADVLAGLVGVDIEQVSLPLIADGENSGLLDLGEAAGAGALSGYASAPSWDEAAAASGAVTSGGALDLSAGVDRDSPMAQVELTSLLGQLNVAGLSQAVVDEVGLALGALGSRATGHIDGEPAGEYLLSGAELTVSSPTLAGLVGQIDAELAEVATTLNNSLGPEGPAQGVLNVLDLPRLNVLGLA
ncbi:choice-of-anchor G family protein, partial [Georgenia sp. 10Sc9-8]|nr:choice-of-anchor G family protein [Georgenia halotolerans]